MKHLIILLLTLSLSTLHSQTLTEQLGGIRTNFTVYFHGKKVDLIDQVVVKRGLSNHKYQWDHDSGYGYGYGLQTLRLELMAREDVAPFPRPKKSYYRFTFFGKDGDKLFSTDVPLSDLLIKVEKICVYSINLLRIPLILLDHTNSINIELLQEQP